MDSKTVYNWIQNKYDEYDKIEGVYSGEKYTNKIFEEACVHFNLSLEEINKLYRGFTYDFKKDSKNNNKKKNKVKTQPKPQVDFSNLHNKKVKINVDLYDKSILSKNFIQFLEENKDTIFTAIKVKSAKNLVDNNTSYIYGLKENDLLYHFHEVDLIEVK